MIAFAKLDKHYLVCIKGNEIQIIKKRGIIDRKVKINNVQVMQGKLMGKRFNIDKLPEFKSDARQVTIIKVRMTSDGKDILGYYYINSYGKINFANKNDLYTFRKVIVINGSIDRGIMVVSNIECLETELAFEPIHYDLDDYYKIYKLYYENELITHDNKKVSSNTMEFGRLQEYSNSSFENFLGYHKELYNILCSSDILRTVKIYDINILNNTKSIISNTHIFYIVTFRYNKYTKSVIIHKSDKKMIALLKYKGAKLVPINANDIKNLVYDTESDDKIISGKSMVDKLNAEKLIEELNKLLSDACEIHINHNKVKIDNNEFKIRRNILIGSSDFRLMNAA